MRQTDCMIRLFTINRVTRFGDRHFTWKEWENHEDEEEELNIFNYQYFDGILYCK